MKRLISLWNVGNENLIALSWKKHHIIQHRTACTATTMTHVALSLIAFTSAFWEEGKKMFTCRDNSITPPFIIAAFRICSGLFEIQIGIKLMEHLTFLLCRHTSQSVAPLRPRTCCFLWHAVWKKMCQVMGATCHLQLKPIWVNEILQDVYWSLSMRLDWNLANVHSTLFA